MKKFSIFKDHKTTSYAYLQFSIIFFLTLDLSFFASPIFAQSPPNLDPNLTDESCTAEQANSGDPKECSGPNGQGGFSYLRYINTVDPDQNQYLCHRTICLDSSGNQLSTPTPSPTPAPTPTSPLPPQSQQILPTKEEQAIYTQAGATLPDQLISQSTQNDNQTFLQTLINKLSSLVPSWTRVLFSKPQNPGKFYVEGRDINSSTLPFEPELEIPQSAQNLKDMIKENYKISVGLPDFADEAGKDVSGTCLEKDWVRANFPDGVDPVTPEGSTCNQ